MSMWKPTTGSLRPGALAHNKFLVVIDSAGNPQAVWTGSTNWTTTGLCTQLNDALLVDDPTIAACACRKFRRGSESALLGRGWRSDR